MAKKKQRTKKPGDNDGGRPADVQRDAMRKWRRRYEALRDDYEELLDRLETIEERVQRRGNEEPALAGRIVLGSLRTDIRRVVAAPWFLLREEYAEAARDIESLVTEMDAFAHRAFKGQRAASDRPAAAPRPVPAEPPVASPPGEAESSRPATSVHVQVHSPNLGALLDFQERLTQLPEVVRVSMSQVNEDRAVLIVDLDADGATAEG